MRGRIAERFLQLLWAGSPRKRACRHRDALTQGVSPSSLYECAECAATGDLWIALRMCATCGHVACCDTSKNKHAKKHAEATGHPIVLSSPEDPEWAWCYVDKTLL